MATQHVEASGWASLSSRRLSGAARDFIRRHERQGGHRVHMPGRGSTYRAGRKCVVQKLDQGATLHREEGDHAHLFNRNALRLFDESLLEVFPGVGDGETIVLFDDDELVLLHPSRYR